MRTLTVTMESSVNSTVTKPGYLIEIGFSTTLRFSTLGDVTWAGNAFSGARSISVRGLTDAAGTIEFGNADDGLTALLLNEGVADKSVRVWVADANALGDDDPVLIFDGVGDEVTVSTEKATVTLAAPSSQVLMSPRRFVGPSSGFNYLTPAGTTVKIGNTTLTLERP